MRRSAREAYRWVRPRGARPPTKVHVPQRLRADRSVCGLVELRSAAVVAVVELGERCMLCEARKRKPMPDLGPLGKLDCPCLPCQAERAAA
jgi:hypothetical protein